VDERGHLVFAVTRTDGEVLYGEYFEVGMPENDNHFNILKWGRSVLLIGKTLETPIRLLGNVFQPKKALRRSN
jgi:hypothetical protein